MSAHPDGVAKRAIVTGGSTGIGVAILSTLLADGYEVVNLSRRPAGIQHAKLTSVSVDLTDGEATRAVIADLAASRPATTIVHNAGVIRQKFLEDVVPEDLTALTQLHLATPIALVQANLAAMKAAHYGRIVLVSSRAVLGLAQRTVYSSTKAGMLGLARTWALELGPFGITSNAIAPGPFPTWMLSTGVGGGGDVENTDWDAVGKRNLVPPLARAGVAIGADGMIVETLPCPEKAWSDGAQSLTLEQFRKMMADLAPYIALWKAARMEEAVLA